MDKTVRNKTIFPKWLLYLGVFVFASSQIVELICFRNAFPMFRTGWLNTFLAGTIGRRLGFVPFILCVFFIVPISEEFIFRKWVDGKKSSYLFSSICISLYLFVSISWLTGLVAIFFLSIIFFSFKEKNKIYGFILLFATSFAFSLSYNFRASSIDIYFVYNFLKNFAFSIIACCLVARHSISHSIILHITYNVLLFLPLFFAHELNVDNYKVSVRPLISTNEGYASFETTDSSFVYRGTMSEIAYLIAVNANADTAFDKNVFYDLHFSPDYIYSVETKKDKCFLKNTLKEMSIRKMFVADTSYCPIFYLSISSQEMLDKNHSGNYCIRDVIAMLRNYYHIPVKPSESVNVYYPCCYECVDVARMKKKLSLDEEIKLLRTIGLTIEKDPHSRAQVITFNYFW